MKKMLASLRKREQRRLRDPLPETLLAKYLRLRPKTSSIQRNSKIIAASAALAIIAAASTAANAQTAAPNVQPIAPAPPEPRSCQRLHEETNKCDAGMRSCDQHVVDRCRRGVSVMRNDHRRGWDRATAASTYGRKMRNSPKPTPKPHPIP